MRLVVFSYKRCWPSATSPSGYATHGGFPIQMKAISELFDATTLMLPISTGPNPSGNLPLTGHNLDVAPLTPLTGQGLRRKLRFPLWMLRNLPAMLENALSADAIHAPIPGDIGTAGMFLAVLMRKPLFVRYCGNWFQSRTTAQRFWKLFMERLAGGKNVMLATGGGPEPPSRRNPNLQWIFSTSLTEDELADYKQTRTLQEPFRLITVGRQEKEKGTHLLIKSLPLIKERYPHLCLDIVGDGGALGDLRKLAGELCLEQSVHFHGRVKHDRVIQLLQDATVFCFPTHSEGFPKAVLEALACGLPVITTRVSVLPELIGSGCGILLEEGSSVEMANAVNGLLADSRKYRQMSRRAVQVASRYSLECWQEQLAGVLRPAWGPLRTHD